VSAVLPNCLPSASRACAAAPSLSGTTSSMMALSRPHHVVEFAPVGHVGADEVHPLPEHEGNERLADRPEMYPHVTSRPPQSQHWPPPPRGFSSPPPIYGADKPACQANILPRLGARRPCNADARSRAPARHTPGSLGTLAPRTRAVRRRPRDAWPSRGRRRQCLKYGYATAGFAEPLRLAKRTTTCCARPRRRPSRAFDRVDRRLAG
jgi:hypothetical protein